MIKTKLSTAGTIVLDSNGNGQVLLEPDSASQSWEVTRVIVRTTQGLMTPPFPQAELFDAPVAVANASHGATYSGHNDFFEPGTPLEIGPNDAILIVWSGGIPGTTASVQVRGFKILQRG